jgi:YD repeat-containing protein
MDSCHGCGSLLELTDTQTSQTVDELLESTRTDVEALGRVCPLCGHRTSEPVSHRKSVQFALLAALVLLASALAVAYYAYRGTERRLAIDQALQQLQSSADVTRYLGSPVVVHGEVTGEVRHDETGWREVRLTMPVRGPKAEGVATVIGGRSAGRWQFTTFEVVVARERKRVDLVAGRVTEYDRDAYVEVHTQATSTPLFVDTSAPPARWDGRFPCVATQAAPGSAPWIGDCPTRVPIATLETGPVDGFEVDLRYGKFVLRQTDLMIAGAMPAPLTRTYTSQFWVHPSRNHAFGVQSTHHFDIAPVGSRNPYTQLTIVLPDNDTLDFSRISRGTGYADAVFQHSETSSRFYKATVRWDGGGWDTRLADGASIHFPESYQAKNMAQGAPTEMRDAKGNALRLVRDPQRNLREIATPDGRWIKLDYDERARVVRAWNDTKDSVDYRYDGDGLLADVRHSDGRSRHYTYDGTLMTAVRDEKGRVLIQNHYRAGKVVQQEDSSGKSYRFRYSMDAGSYHVAEATVTFPDGATRTVRPADSVPDWLRHLKR